MESRIQKFLTSPIDYMRDGLKDECNVVELVAPSKKLLRKTYRLQQFLMQSLVQAQETFKNFVDESADTKEEKLDGKKVMTMLLASNVDIDSCMSEFEKLALAGAVEVEGKPINKIQIDSLSAEDLEALMADYLANFIMSLVTRNLKSS